MSNIDIRRFVDIDIIHHSTSSVNSIRDTVVLLSTETGTNATYSSLTEYLNDTTLSATSLTTLYATVYFTHGGNKLRIIYNITKDTLEALIESLPDEQIIVAYTGEYEDIKNVAKNREASEKVYGVKQKILLGRTSEIDTDLVANFAAKYSNVTGAEMTIGAYLSKIDIYGVDTVHDYMFTKEYIDEEDIDTDTYDEIIDANMNVDVYLANATLNVGGNLKDGLSLVNQYMLIVLHQTLTERLLNLLTTKIEGQRGLAAIQTTMTQELTRYVTNGYLTTDKYWSDEDLYITYNDASYEIIAKNTPLLLGYSVCILPYNSLSDDEKKDHKTPPIYVILADSYGIRTITINGEVI